MQRAGRLWYELGEEFGTKLLPPSGLLTMDLPGSDPIHRIQLCVELKQLEIECLSAEEIRYRFPAFRVPDNFIGFLEPGAGWLDVDPALSGMQKRASQLVAELCLDEAVSVTTAVLASPG